MVKNGDGKIILDHGMSLIKSNYSVGIRINEKDSIHGKSKVIKIH